MKQLSDREKKTFRIFGYVAVCMILCLRFIEGILISYNIGFSFKTLQFECLGVIIDLAFVGGLLFLYYPIFLLNTKFNPRFTIFLSLFLGGILSIAHLLIVGYFVYEGQMLDIFIYKYPIREIIFTVTTSGIPLFPVFIVSLLFGLIPTVLYFLFQRINNVFLQNLIKNKGFKVIGFISLIIFIGIQFLEIDARAKNKSFDFYMKSIRYVFSSDKPVKLTDEDVHYFQSLYPHKKFISSRYPLLHERNKENGLYEQLKTFDSTPNIVVLIVEGLSDDFIYNYHDIELMPFMGQFKDSCLYWNHCFAQGERSFAAVPAILGSLPFGRDGFTSLDIYPRHHSLVNLLGSRGYQTNYFTSVDAWFHTINKWLKYSQSDLIIDKSNFDKKYHKIHVDKYFWGYNDKDLYSQYFETLEKLPSKPYFNTFFTATSHPPYIIPEQKKYEKLIQQYQNTTNQRFIQENMKYLIAVRFVDDALKYFFDKYSQRKDFENTIFIITGDHQNTELPRENALKKYHVPMLIYSPKLKHPKTYNNTVCHLDVMPTIQNLLENYHLKFPETTTVLGQSLFEDTPREIPFMTGNFELNDYYSNGYFISGNNHYVVTKNLDLLPLKDKEQIASLQEKRKNFQIINEVTSFRNQIMDEQLFQAGLRKKNLYTYRSENQIQLVKEFTNIIDGIQIANHSFYIESLLDIELPSKYCNLVFEVKNVEDSLLSWKSIAIDKKGLKQNRIYFDSINNQQDSIYLSSYYWNRKDEKVIMNTQKIILFENH